MAGGIQMPGPVCLIGNQDADTLVLNEDALRILDGITQPVVVVAIVGKYRTGKSYLMNKLAKRNSGFALGSAIQSKTKGIWMWCLSHPTEPNHTLVLLDTEGLGDVEKGDSKNDMWIFSLAVLLSSTFVYNSVGTIDQDSLEKLHYVTELTEYIKLKSVTEKDADESPEFKRFFPNFIWCVRDFFLKLEKEEKAITEDEYLQNSLKLKKGHSKKVADYNLLRECITHYFHSHKCFVFERPASGPMLQCLEELTEDQLERKFVEQANTFQEYIYKTSKPKALSGGLTVSGKMLGYLTISYVEAIRSGSVPCLENAVVNLAKIENMAAIHDGVSSYECEMTWKQSLFPVDQEKFMELHSDCERKAVEVFLERSFKDDTREYQAKLMLELNQKFEMFRKSNEQASETKCRAIIDDLSVTLEEQIANKFFCKPGGHKEFVQEKEWLITNYMKTPGKGVKAQEVLEEFLQVKKEVETSILHMDNSLSENQREMEKQMMENEAMQRKLKLEEEKQLRMEEMLKEQEKNFEQQAVMLKSKLEDDRLKMQKENDWLIEQKMKERDALEKQGFQDKAMMMNEEVQDLKTQNQSDPFKAIMKGIGLLAEAASLVLPGVYGKISKVASKVLQSMCGDSDSTLPIAHKNQSR
uniref:GB1/RHD3-type G domain-containing protein n=1 Tax=Leptobrachium leishanense TaxID=445787 RepID=A0A8C5R9Z8_9ANUR